MSMHEELETIMTLANNTGRGDLSDHLRSVLARYPEPPAAPVGMPTRDDVCDVLANNISPSSLPDELLRLFPAPVAAKDGEGVTTGAGGRTEVGPCGPYSAIEQEALTLARQVWPGRRLHVASGRLTGRGAQFDSGVLEDETEDGDAAQRGEYAALVDVRQHPRAPLAMLAALRCLADAPAPAQASEADGLAERVARLEKAIHEGFGHPSRSLVASGKAAIAALGKGGA